MFEDDYYDLNVNDSFNIDSISIIRSESDNLYKYEIDDCLKSVEKKNKKVKEGFILNFI